MTQEPRWQRWHFSRRNDSTATADSNCESEANNSAKLNRRPDTLRRIMSDPATSRPLDTHPHYDEFAAAFGDVRARGPIDYRRIEVVDPEMADVFRMNSVGQKIEILAKAHRMARTLIAIGVRSRHPLFDQEAVDREVFRRLIDGAA